MTDNLFSSVWYRVAKLKPKLKDHVNIYRHEYRNKPWYVLEDKSTGRYHRFNDIAYYIIGKMNSERTIQQIWDLANTRLGDDAPTQDELIELLAKLHTADLLLSDVQICDKELFSRLERQKKLKIKQRFSNPLSLKFSLFDPEKFLSKTIKYVQWIFSFKVFILWALYLLSAVITMGLNWEPLTEGVVDRVFNAQNLILLWFTYPLIKLLHELGHAYATKKWGGEVHELGIVLMALMPIPFVDASSASCFIQRHRRIIVGAAGMMVELFIASTALFIWLSVESLFIKAICFNLMLIGSVSTLFFNGNPLLRYDGYYILADMIGLPNLATNSKRYLGYVFQKKILGIENLREVEAIGTEKAWYLGYAVFSFLYRLVVLFSISVFLSSKFFFLGVALAVWGVVQQVVVPTVKNVHFLLKNPKLQTRRLKVLFSTVGSLVLFSLFFFFAPLSVYTVAEGIVWVPEESIIRTKAEGFVKKLLVEVNENIKKNEPILELENNELLIQKKIIDAELQELENIYYVDNLESPAKAKITQEKIIKKKAELEDIEEELADLTVKAQDNGKLYINQASDLIGQFVKKGQIVGYVINKTKHTARVVVHQNDIELINDRVKSVEVRMVDKALKVGKGKLIRKYPEASFELPSAALGHYGGGNIVVKGDKEDKDIALEKYFQLEVELPKKFQDSHLGSRVYVRLYYGKMSLAKKWYRSIRQLFLRKFDV